MPAKITGPNDPRVQAFVGKIFGRLKVVKFWGRKTNSNGTTLMFECECECGTKRTVAKDSLVSGSTQSCGCLHSEITKRVTTVHGFNKPGKRHPVYNVWANMLRRCENPNNPHFEEYGGRNISVCERWHDFRLFAEDMLATYRPGLTLERIDNNGNYEPSNCRWATRKEQMLNRRNNIFLTFNGQRLTVSQWSEKTGLRYGVISQRIGKLKWSVEKALTTKAIKHV